MNKQLIEAVKAQLKADNDEELSQTLKDVYNHGADAGFNGFTYYTETIQFFDNNRDAILESVKELANDLGEDPITMITGFSCLKSHELTAFEVAEAIYNDGEFEDQVKNALAWYALEEVARCIEELEDPTA